VLAKKKSEKRRVRMNMANEVGGEERIQHF